MLAPTLPLFLAATAVLGAANAFTTPLLMAVLAATVPGDRLGRALGWFAAMQAAGSTSAPLVGGLVAEADWRLAFTGVAVVVVALALIGIPADPTAGGEPPGYGRRYGPPCCAPGWPPPSAGAA